MGTPYILRILLFAIAAGEEFRDSHYYDLSDFFEVEHSNSFNDFEDLPETSGFRHIDDEDMSDEDISDMSDIADDNYYYTDEFDTVVNTVVGIPAHTVTSFEHFKAETDQILDQSNNDFGQPVIETDDFENMDPELLDLVSSESELGVNEYDDYTSDSHSMIYGDDSMSEFEQIKLLNNIANTEQVCSPENDLKLTINDQIVA